LAPADGGPHPLLPPTPKGRLPYKAPAVWLLAAPNASAVAALERLRARALARVRVIGFGLGFGFGFGLGLGVARRGRHSAPCMGRGPWP
jgi:hypothetical protein